MKQEILFKYREMLLCFLEDVDKLIKEGESEEMDFGSLIEDLNDSNKNFMYNLEKNNQ